MRFLMEKQRDNLPPFMEKSNTAKRFTALVKGRRGFFSGGFYAIYKKIGFFCEKGEKFLPKVLKLCAKFGKLYIT